MQSPDIAASFQQGLALHKQGQLVDAANHYRSVLALAPDHAETLHLLGVLEHQSSRHAEAVVLIDRAIAVDPGPPAYYSNLGAAQQALGRMADALVSFDRALERRPAYPEALVNRATLLLQLERPADALANLDAESPCAPSSSVRG